MPREGMKQNPLVSVIVPCYNKERFIVRTLESLRSQTYDNFEVKIVDDSSTDDSWRIIQNYVGLDDRFSGERNKENKGGNYCRNRGYALSSGEYLIFLDADDWLADDCIEVRVAEMQRDTEKEWDIIVFPSIASGGGRLFNFNPLRPDSDALLGFLRQGSPWQTMMPIWRRDAFERINGFDETFSRLQDVELFSRALLNGLTYKAAERQTYDCYYCEDKSRLMDLFRMARNTAGSMMMFIEKMKGYVHTKSQASALAETELVAIRTVGDIFQAGGISAAYRNELYSKIQLISSIPCWSKIYSLCYRFRINKLRGFNYMFFRLYRILTY